VATLYCDLWLRSDATNADSTTAQSVHTLAPPPTADPVRPLGCAA
jgi:hypothetical protein